MHRLYEDHRDSLNGRAKPRIRIFFSEDGTKTMAFSFVGAFPDDCVNDDCWEDWYDGIWEGWSMIVWPWRPALTLERG